MADTLVMNPTLKSALEQMKKCNDDIHKLENTVKLVSPGVVYAGKTKEQWKKELDNYKATVGGKFSSQQLSALQTAGENYNIDASLMVNLFKNKTDLNGLIDTLERDKIATEIKEMSAAKNKCENQLKGYNNQLSKINQKSQEYKKKINDIKKQLENIKSQYNESEIAIADLKDKYTSHSKSDLEAELENYKKRIFTISPEEKSELEDLDRYLNGINKLSKLENQYNKLAGDSKAITMNDIEAIEQANKQAKDEYKINMGIWNTYNRAYERLGEFIKNGKINPYRVTQYKDKNGNIVGESKTYEIESIGAEGLYILGDSLTEVLESAYAYFQTQLGISKEDAKEAVNNIFKDIKAGNSYTEPKPSLPADYSTLVSLQAQLEYANSNAESISPFISQAQNCIDNNDKTKLKKKLKEAQKKVDEYNKKKPKTEKQQSKTEFNNEKNTDESGVQRFAPGAINTSDTVIDIESTRYSQTPYGNRVGYTLLSCGDYRANTHNNGLNGNYSDKTSSLTTNITFVLPLPDGSVNLDTSVNWNAQEENGFNEVAATMNLPGTGEASKGITGTGVVRSGINKWVQGKAAEMLKDVGLDGGLRGAGIAYNPNNQMYFKDVELSSFDYTFSLTPKSAEEAKKVKMIAEAINLLMLPGTTQNGDNINFLSAIGACFNAGEGLRGLASGKGTILDTAIKGVVNLFSSGIGWLVNKFADTNGLSSPYFSYPGLWNVGIYVIKDDNTDFPILEVTRLAMKSCKLDMGSSNGVTWHPDGYPTVMKLSLSFTETQYRTKENMFNMLKFLGNDRDESKYKNAVENKTNNEILIQNSNQAINQAKKEAATENRLTSILANEQTNTEIWKKYGITNTDAQALLNKANEDIKSNPTAKMEIIRLYNEKNLTDNNYELIDALVEKYNK